MDEKEAIARLRDHFSVHDDCRPTPKLNEAVSIVIKATEKQIPKKPKITRNSACITFGMCPNCGTEIDCLENPFYHKDSDCLQKLDWSDV